MVQLTPTPSGGPYDITATNTDTGETLTIHDVLFGDIFFCSGQSNMNFEMKKVSATCVVVQSGNLPKWSGLHLGSVTIFLWYVLLATLYYNHTPQRENPSHMYVSHTDTTYTPTGS